MCNVHPPFTILSWNISTITSISPKLFQPVPNCECFCKMGLATEGDLGRQQYPMTSAAAAVLPAAHPPHPLPNLLLLLPLFLVALLLLLLLLLLLTLLSCDSASTQKNKPWKQKRNRGGSNRKVEAPGAGPSRIKNFQSRYFGDGISLNPRIFWDGISVKFWSRDFNKKSIRSHWNKCCQFHTF